MSDAASRNVLSEQEQYANDMMRTASRQSSARKEAAAAAR